MFEGRDAPFGFQRCGLPDRRRSMGMIFQQFNLLAVRLRKHLLAGACLPESKRHAARERAAQALLELVNLSDRAQSYPSQLSGRQKQLMWPSPALWLPTPQDPPVRRRPLPAPRPRHCGIHPFAHQGHHFSACKGIAAIIITHEMSADREKSLANQRSPSSATGGLPKPARSKRFSSTPQTEKRASSSFPDLARTYRTASYTGSFSTAAPRLSRSSAIWCWNAGLPSTSCLPTRATSAGRHSARWCCNFRTTKRSSGVSSPMPTPRD